MSDYTYEGTRRIAYDIPEFGLVQFIAICEKCSRFVKPPETGTITKRFGDIQSFEPHVECSRCGPTTMPCEGVF